MQHAIQGLDELLASAAAAAGLSAPDFQRLPKSEQNAFLAQARGQSRPEAKTGRLQLAAPSEIVKSPFNRTNFDPDKLAKLAADVKRDGIIQPLLVRTNPQGAGWELIAGERRWRAAAIAGLSELPIIIREATDREAIELQFAENDDREDLNPMDEARKFQQLRDCYESDGLQRTAAIAKIATLTHRSQSGVYSRLALLELPEDALKACEDGKLPASHAELITKIQDPDAQTRLLKKILKPDPNDGEATEKGVLGFRDAKTLADQATEQLKQERSWQSETAAYTAHGAKVLTIEQSSGLFQYGNLKPTHVGADAKCDLDAKGRRWRELLGKAAPQEIVAKHPWNSGPQVVYTRKEAVKALELAGHGFAQGSDADRTAAKKRSVEDQRRRQEEENAREKAQAFESIGKIVGAAQAREFNPDVLRFIARQLLQTAGSAQGICERRAIKHGEAYDAADKALLALIAKADGKALRGIMIELALYDYDVPVDGVVHEAAKLFKVKVQTSGKPKGSK